MGNNDMIPLTFFILALAVIWLAIFSIIVDSWSPIKKSAIMAGMVGASAALVAPILYRAFLHRPIVGYERLAFVALALWFVIFGMISGLGLSMALTQEYKCTGGQEAKTSRQLVLVTRSVGALLMAWAVGINIYIMLR